MITRTYEVLMPSDNSDVDIPVEGNANWGTIGAAPIPVAAGNDGFYAEWRNRPIRVPIKAGTGAAAAAGFVPRFRLGVGVDIQAVSAQVPNVPAVRFSRSLVGDVLSTVGGATTPGDGTFQDPSGAPTIRVVGNAAYAGVKFRLTLLIPEASNEGQSPTAR